MRQNSHPADDPGADDEEEDDEAGHGHVEAGLLVRVRTRREPSCTKHTRMKCALSMKVQSGVKRTGSVRGREDVDLVLAQPVERAAIVQEGLAGQSSTGRHVQIKEACRANATRESARCVRRLRQLTRVEFHVLGCHFVAHRRRRCTLNSVQRNSTK